ncbi:hypothetical protein [Pseudarthrobacter sp. DSP2-3-2b1]|uniref:hypothetical protein n=1 Tax=Pseudarthrobacter sp. DSP2-3-2b1 TaxID=2804661 RepID=UPI003CF22268
MRKRHVTASAFLVMVLVAAGCAGQSPPVAGELLLPNVYVTAYSWFDNTPAGSPAISHPVLHQTAGGTGTYEDPVTVAVGHSLETGEDVLDIPAGTKIYVPSVRRYFIVEDTCGDGPSPEDGPCHSGAEEFGDASLWIDLWIGGEGERAALARSCAKAITGVHTVILNPGGNYLVASGAGVIHEDSCDADYGNTVITK